MYNINIHMTCVDNPKSKDLIERFHLTLIEHLRILNQREHFKQKSNTEKIQFATIAYKNSISSITKYASNEVLFGLVKTKEF